MPKAEENDPSAPTPDVPNTNTDKPTDATESENDDSTEKPTDSEDDYDDGTSDESGETKKGLSAGAIVGIVAGSVAVGGVGGFALFWFAIKKKSFADLIAVFKKK